MLYALIICMSVNSQGGNDQFPAISPMRQGTYLRMLVRPDVVPQPSQVNTYMLLVVAV